MARFILGLFFLSAWLSVTAQGRIILAGKVTDGRDGEPVEFASVVIADGQVAGSAGCNTYSGDVTSDGGQMLTVGPLINTQMACPEPIMEQETTYLQALQSALQWSYVAGQLGKQGLYACRLR